MKTCRDSSENGIFAFTGSLNIRRLRSSGPPLVSSHCYNYSIGTSRCWVHQPKRISQCRNVSGCTDGSFLVPRCNQGNKTGYNTMDVSMNVNNLMIHCSRVHWSLPRHIGNLLQPYGIWSGANLKSHELKDEGIKRSFTSLDQSGYSIPERFINVNS